MFIYKRLPQNFKVRRLTFRNISKRTKTGVLQRILTLFHRHYLLERNKKNLWQPFLDNFQTKRTKKKSKQIGQEKVALTITGAGVVARKLTFSNNISELLDGAPPAPRWLFDYITVTTSLSQVICRWLVAYVHWSWLVSRSHRWHSQTKSKVRDEPNIQNVPITLR